MVGTAAAAAAAAAPPLAAAAAAAGELRELWASTGCERAGVRALFCSGVSRTVRAALLDSKPGVGWSTV